MSHSYQDALHVGCEPIAAMLESFHAHGRDMPSVRMCRTEAGKSHYYDLTIVSHSEASVVRVIDCGTGEKMYLKTVVLERSDPTAEDMVVLGELEGEIETHAGFLEASLPRRFAVQLAPSDARAARHVKHLLDIGIWPALVTLCPPGFVTLRDHLQTSRPPMDERVELWRDIDAFVAEFTAVGSHCDLNEDNLLLLRDPKTGRYEFLLIDLARMVLRRGQGKPHPYVASVYRDIETLFRHADIWPPTLEEYMLCLDRGMPTFMFETEAAQVRGYRPDRFAELKREFVKMAPYLLEDSTSSHREAEDTMERWGCAWTALWIARNGDDQDAYLRLRKAARAVLTERNIRLELMSM